ncbi:hypothetical protein Sjap_011399 [Stephania japonica]|uniref:Acid phosphatase n=1 Tax=Stephania japonica TaxID=461633 RepID=A0AAP0P4P3_9MAGN
MDEVITVTDASSSHLTSNLLLLSAFCRLRYRPILEALHHLERKWDSRRMFGSGGMPSSHSATVTALAVAIGLRDGTGGSRVDDVDKVVSENEASEMGSGSQEERRGGGGLGSWEEEDNITIMVMYDASGVRLHASKQAEIRDEAKLYVYLFEPLIDWMIEVREVLNQIVCELPTEHPLSNARPLRELLGHTPLQV